MTARRTVMAGGAVAMVAGLVGCNGWLERRGVPRDPDMSAAEVLELAELAVPDAELSLEPGPKDSERSGQWIVSFSAPRETVDEWVLASFGRPLSRVAHDDDSPEFTELLGEGVQKAGDHVASGRSGRTQVVVVVGQGDHPAVNIGVLLLE